MFVAHLFVQRLGLRAKFAFHCIECVALLHQNAAHVGLLRGVSLLTREQFGGWHVFVMGWPGGGPIACSACVESGHGE